MLKKVLRLSKKNLIIGIIGNLCEHYDNALFGFLAPFIAPLFFPEKSILCALILTYGILFLGAIFRPLGAIVFGYIGDNFGRRKTLFLTIIGTAITCLLISFSPTYYEAKIFAPIYLATLKAMQGFFAAGETSAGAIFVLESSHENKKSIISSLYDASSICGILIASLGVFTLSSLHLIETHWRILFLIGSFSATIGIFIRSKTLVDVKESPPQNKGKIKDIFLFLFLRKNFQGFFTIALLAGFSYSIYYFSLSFFNGYLPIISNISKTQAIKTNTYLLILDFCFLPFFGFLAQRFSKEKMMLLSSFTMIICIFPIFSLLKNGSLALATSVRIILVIIGVWFSAPLHHLALEIAEEKYRFQIIGLAYALGSQFIGMPSCMVGLWLYKKTNLVFAPAIYLFIFSIAACFSILNIKQKLSRDYFEKGTPSL